MTLPPNWRELPAGRALNALVAEHVMGWTWHTYWCGSEELRGLFPPPYSGSYQDHDQFPEFSDDMADAWPIVEKLRADGCVINLVISPADNAVYVTTAIGHRLHVVGSDVPYLVCRAALATTEAPT